MPHCQNPRLKQQKKKTRFVATDVALIKSIEDDRKET